MNTLAYAASSARAPLAPWTFERRAVGANDVQIELLYCGICHSDIHTVRDEWGPQQYPLVPGHEMVGRVVAVGKKVKRFKKGDLAGVGCMVDSCGKCAPCREDEEQFCEKGCAFTYGGTEMDRKTVTQGGYASQIVCDQKFVLKLRVKVQQLAGVAPLLCAGITTWSPLKRFGVKKGHRVGIIGLGGLGHMGVKLARALGARVVVFSTSAGKEADARRLGAHEFVNTRAPDAFEKCKGGFDFILDTVSATHDPSPYLGLLKRGGRMTVVGASPEPLPVGVFGLIFGRRELTGSLIGGIRETQAMLDFCAKKKVFADIELIPAAKINEAYERTIKSDVKFRFVIDLKTLA